MNRVWPKKYPQAKLLAVVFGCIFIMGFLALLFAALDPDKAPKRALPDYGVSIASEENKLYRADELKQVVSLGGSALVETEWGNIFVYDADGHLLLRAYAPNEGIEAGEGVFGLAVDDTLYRYDLEGNCIESLPLKGSGASLRVPKTSAKVNGAEFLIERSGVYRDLVRVDENGKSTLLHHFNMSVSPFKLAMIPAGAFLLGFVLVYLIKNFGFIIEDHRDMMRKLGWIK